MMLEAGTKAPGFTLPDDGGRQVSLSDFAGKKIVLYFYPKDDTPGCTTEACGFRDLWSRLRERQVEVIGVSADPPESHRKFRDKYSLPFILLSDADRNVIRQYGAWGEKDMYGKKVMGLIRSTFIIDADGTIAKVFPKVKPENHAEEVLSAIG